MFDNITNKEGQNLLRTVQIFAAISTVIVSIAAIGQYVKAQKEFTMAKERHALTMQHLSLQVAALKKNI